MDSKFIEITDLLNKIHEDFPDMRFGMILQSAVDIFKKTKNADFHDMTSKQLLKALDDFHAIHLRKRQKVINNG